MLEARSDKNGVVQKDYQEYKNNVPVFVPKLLRLYFCTIKKALKRV